MAATLNQTFFCHDFRLSMTSNQPTPVSGLMTGLAEMVQQLDWRAGSHIVLSLNLSHCNPKSFHHCYCDE